MKIKISPSCARGQTAAPPSKSMAHRLLIAAGLAPGESRIDHIAYSEDVLATIDCLEALGAEIRRQGDTVLVRGTDPKQAQKVILPCRECGSTLRFFLPLALLGKEPITLTGSAKLLSRPLSVYEKLMEERELPLEKGEGFLTVQGPLSAGSFEVAGNISSQFISGLLFALPLLEGDSEIRILPPVESRPYIDLTLSALKDFGIRADFEGNRIFIPGGQSYQPRHMRVEGDYSNAAFLEALNLMDGHVTVTGLREDSLQGDRIYRQHFEALAKGFAEIDLGDCPDLGPVLMALAAALHGAHFTGTKRLAMKESDRGEAMAEELLKFGIRTERTENTITVEPGRLQKPETVLQSHNDHRIAMALSVLLAKTGDVLEGAEAVNKSFPDFYRALQSLGIEVEYVFDRKGKGTK